MMVLIIELGKIYDFKWPSEQLKVRRDKNFWHHLRHHKELYEWQPPREVRKSRRGGKPLQLAQIIAVDLEVSKTMMDMMIRDTVPSKRYVMQQLPE